MSLTLQAIEAANAEARILVDTCKRCGCQQAMPAPTCFDCGHDVLDASDHAGTGHIFSWVVAHYAFEPELADQIPYTLVMTSLDGGARVYGRLINGPDNETLMKDMAVVLDAAETRNRGYLTFRPAVAA